MLGGNSSTLAYVTSLRADAQMVSIAMVPLAQTPIGVVAGDKQQNAGVAMANLLNWLDTTFPPEDDLSFVAPIRDVELLARINWEVEPPERLREAAILNAEDLPDEVAMALVHDPEPLVQCGACRRLCVRDHFVWKERQLCAWDYHKQVFGKRGPWHTGPYEERHFETLPKAAYVAAMLIEEGGVDTILLLSSVEDRVARQAVNVVLEGDPERPHMAVRTDDGYALLREK